MAQDRYIQEVATQVQKPNRYASILPLALKLGVVLAFVYGLHLILSPAVVTVVMLLVGVAVFFEVASFVLRIVLTIISAVFTLALVGLVLGLILSTIF